MATRDHAPVEFTIEFGGFPQDVTIALAGAPSPPDFTRLVEALGADPRARAGMAMLVDLAALDVSSLTEEEIAQGIQPVAARDWAEPALAVALVAPTDPVFQAATLWRAHLGGARSRREVFRSREDALAWLRGQRG
jgi:hypothetical protein